MIEELIELFPDNYSYACIATVNGSKTVEVLFNLLIYKHTYEWRGDELHSTEHTNLRKVLQQQVARKES